MMQKYLAFMAVLGLFAACSPEPKEEAKDEPVSQDQEKIDEDNVMNDYPG